MFVDLSSINNSDYKLEYQEKSKILLDYLGEPNGKFLIVPIHILNILQESTEFVSCEINSDISGVEKVGNINGYDCYVDSTWIQMKYFYTIIRQRLEIVS